MSQVGEKLVAGLQEAIAYERGYENMGRSEYRKTKSGLCHYCDYHCRKGHKCGWYKHFVKRFP